MTRFRLNVGSLLAEVRASTEDLIGEQRFSGRDLGTGEGMPAERILVRHRNSYRICGDTECGHAKNIFQLR